MTRIFALIIIVNAVMTFGSPLVAQTESVFTYQGQLKLNGSPVTSSGCDFEFSLFADAGGVTQIGMTQTIIGVAVTDGLFTVELNSGSEFGPTAFIGDERFLEIAVKCPPQVSFTALSPLQPITPAPYALALPGLRTMPSGDVFFPDSINVIGGDATNNVSANVGGATISGGGPSSAPNSVTASLGTVGGGGGNSASGFVSTISGGNFHEASGPLSTIGGGQQNIASGTGATVPGGFGNKANGDNSFAAGRRAIANHNGTFVWADSNFNDFVSTDINQFLIKATGGVGIGTNNPQHQLDIVGDRMRIKNSAGTRDILLRVDGGAADIQSETSNLFLHSTGPSGNNHVIINSQPSEGSVGIHTQAPSFTLHVNGSAGKPGGGSWSNSSDRRLKKNIEELDGSLDQLMKLRGVTFQYKDPDSINELHGTRIGMIAQEVEKVVPDWVDTREDGYKAVTYRGFEALTVEALRELRDEKDVEIAALRAENDALRTRLDSVEALVEKIAKLDSP